MRLVTFIASDGEPRAGALLGPAVVDLAAAAPLALEETTDLQWDLLSLLRGTADGGGLEDVAEILSAVVSQVGSDLPTAATLQGNGSHNPGMTGSISIGGIEMLLPAEQVRLLAPLPRPFSVRLFDGFEQHVAAMQHLRGQPIPPAWYYVPSFTFGNHNAVYGHDAPVPLPSADMLDYELELACVIGREGRDIATEEALHYIAGYTIANDWSTRESQIDPALAALDNAKAKDFALSLGPWLVTTDELEIYADDDGQLSLTMAARVNGIGRARGNAASLHYSFAQMIAYASQDATLYPGDVLCSGAVGGGSLAEAPTGQGEWLQRGDMVELEITGLGVLRNHIV